MLSFRQVVDSFLTEIPQILKFVGCMKAEELTGFHKPKYAAFSEIILLLLSHCGYF